MTDPHPRYAGLWLPFVTPFKDDKLDERSLGHLARAYAGKVDGFVLCATTGEGMALSSDEARRVVQTVAEAIEDAGTGTKIMLGLHGSSTSAVVQSLRVVESWRADAVLVSCPHYVRPSQEGLRLHFEALADSTDADLLIYNIPYRTGVNLQNDTLLRLAERSNVLGVKDCCADFEQSRDLIRRKPRRFAVLAGDDARFGVAVKDGADGGVLASAHLDPRRFRQLQDLDRSGGAIDQAWTLLSHIPELLFCEPNPAPLKYCLWRMGLIDSPEVRLPMTPVSTSLAQRLDSALANSWVQ